MRSRISESKAFKKAFREAYFSKERQVSGDQWRSQVMKRIGQIGPLNDGIDFWSPFQDMAWRLTPVSSLLIIALSILLLKMYFDLGHDYLGTWMAELDEINLAELFGLEG